MQHLYATEGLFCIDVVMNLKTSLLTDREGVNTSETGVETKSCHSEI